MLAVLGFCVQAWVTGKGVINNTSCLGTWLSVFVGMLVVNLPAGHHTGSNPKLTGISECLQGMLMLLSAESPCSIWCRAPEPQRRAATAQTCGCATAGPLENAVDHYRDPFGANGMHRASLFGCMSLRRSIRTSFTLPGNFSCPESDSCKCGLLCSGDFDTEAWSEQHREALVLSLLGLNAGQKHVRVS